MGRRRKRGKEGRRRREGGERRREGERGKGERREGERRRERGRKGERGREGKRKTHLLYLSNPTADIFLQCIQERRVGDKRAQIFNKWFLPRVRGPFDSGGDGVVNGEGDFRDINILLEVQ